MHWEGDTVFKTICTISIVERLVFGPILGRILLELDNKKKWFPEEKPAKPTKLFIPQEIKYIGKGKTEI